MNIRVVTKEREVDINYNDIDLAPYASDENIISAVARHLDEDLSEHIISRQGENVLISPTPVFG